MFKFFQKKKDADESSEIVEDRNGAQENGGSEKGHEIVLNSGVFDDVFASFDDDTVFEQEKTEVAEKPISIKEEQPQQQPQQQQEPAVLHQSDDQNKASAKVAVKQTNHTALNESNKSSENAPNNIIRNSVKSSLKTPANSAVRVPAQTQQINQIRTSVAKAKTVKTAVVNNQVNTVAEPPKQIKTKPQPRPEYQFPEISCLDDESAQNTDRTGEDCRVLQKTFDSYGVSVDVLGRTMGPNFVQYEVKPDSGVRISKIKSMSSEIKIALGASDLQFQIPIRPGTSSMGLLVPATYRNVIRLKPVLQESKQTLGIIPMGKDLYGNIVYLNWKETPHLLISGMTGAGKSIFIHNVMLNLLFTASPEDLKIILVDTRAAELMPYSGLPHLIVPIVTDSRRAAVVLNWAVAEMNSRYQRLTEYGVRNIDDFNRQITSLHLEDVGKMPEILVIIDDYSELMAVNAEEVESAICRLAQMARAAGIHVIISTQRPSVNVVTRLIKSNMPNRVAFTVASSIDSRVILDESGAEKLLGEGDMYYKTSSIREMQRLQGIYISNNEIHTVVSEILSRNAVRIALQNAEKPAKTANRNAETQYDGLLPDAALLIVDKDKASIGMLQRYFKIGFNRAAHIMDQLEEVGVVGQEKGTAPREILMSEREVRKLFENK